MIMATNLAINETLLDKALELGGFRSKKDTVNAALEEFIRRRKAEDVIDLFGKIEYESDYDYKKMRSR
jgi:Arc/MetJ family transcription regulator